MRIKNVPVGQRSQAASKIPEKETRTMKEVPHTKLAESAETPNIEEEIRKRAYELFEARGGEDGHELDDWLRAEEEIKGSETNAVAA
jgi:hypothetical protein